MTTATAEPAKDVVLSLSELVVTIDSGRGPVRVLDGVDLEVGRGEIVGLVGESGCGKSMTALASARLLPPVAQIEAGRVLLNIEGDAPAVDLTRLGDAAMRLARGRHLGIVFQEPGTALNPVFTVGEQVAEAITRRRDAGAGGGAPKTTMQRLFGSWRRALDGGRDARRASAALLAELGIADAESVLDAYPHEISGGQRQRVLLAMALAADPGLLIADEPTTSLDVTIQAEILDVLKRTSRRAGTAVLLITHHVGVVAEACDRVAVMYSGQVVESAPTRDLLEHAEHPYTRGLLASVPPMSGDAVDLPVIPGAVPDPATPPTGCRFHPRCPIAVARCREERPRLTRVRDGHLVACHLVTTAKEGVST